VGKEVDRHVVPGSVLVRPPVVVADGADVTIFDSPEGAENYHEWIDVEGGELRAWDSDGKTLSMGVVEDVRLTRLLREKREKRVVIREATPSHDGSKELRDLLIGNLVLHGEDQTTLSMLEVRELVSVAASFYGVSGR
jgi:hypothetical protein